MAHELSPSIWDFPFASLIITRQRMLLGQMLFTSQPLHLQCQINHASNGEKLFRISFPSNPFVVVRSLSGSGPAARDFATIKVNREGICDICEVAKLCSFASREISRGN